MIDKYNDIINLPHHVSKYHKPMSISDRAAQFAPFSALTGYAESINESGRLVDKKLELIDEDKEMICNKINYLLSNKDKQIEVMIVYFIKDDKKDGGRYQSISGIINKLNIEENYIQLQDKTKIYLLDILSINSNVFEVYD